MKHKKIADNLPPARALQFNLTISQFPQKSTCKKFSIYNLFLYETGYRWIKDETK